MLRKVILPLVLLFGVLAILFSANAGAQRERSKAPSAGRTATAVFAGGCFWCTESDFDKMPGVVATVSGYTGGRVANPTYEQVSAGTTGHIEAVRVTYDPARISYGELVARFLPTVDPFDTGGSFCDRGHQYRAAIFVADAAQRATVQRALDAAARRLGRSPTILIQPSRAFYPAEDYHQDYYRKNPIRYRYYRSRCGRDDRLAEVWGRR